MTDSTRRFSGRVDDYVRYRPGYPDELIEALMERCGLGPGATVADIGSGTGIFSAKLLDAGLRVYAVEPNDAMRAAAERQLAARNGFTSVAAAAESTALDTDSLDLITAAQAFHWFNNEPARNEFRRVLKPGGYLALIWNRRRTGRAFQDEYDALLRRRAPDYGKVNHMNLDDREIADFYAPETMRKLRFDYRQRLDFDSLLGRLRSSSYCPAEDSDAFRLLRDELAVLFDRHAVDGRIDFEYDTHLYLGRMPR